MIKKLGLTSIILLGINGIIGGGIFLVPGKAMALAGPACLWIYLLVSVMVGFITLCFADCASLFSRNGAAYIYAREAFGDFVGFNIGVLKWVASIIAWAAMTAAFMTSLGAIWPESNEEPLRTLLITVLFLFLGAANLLGANVFQRLNNMVTISKLVPLVILVAFGAYYMDLGNFEFVSPLELDTQSLATSVVLIFYAFAGFESLAVASEEMENPRKNLPIALVIVLFAVAIIYFAVQAISIGVLGEELAFSITPVIDVTTAMFGTVGRWLVAVASLLSIGGIMVAASFFTPRSGEALAHDDIIPRHFATKNRYGVPYLSIIISVALTLLLSLYGNFIQLATISVLARATQYFPTCLAVIFLRTNNPSERFLGDRIRNPIAVIASLASLWLLFQAPFEQILIGFGLMALLTPAYFLRRAYIPVS